MSNEGKNNVGIKSNQTFSIYNVQDATVAVQQATTVKVARVGCALQLKKVCASWHCQPLSSCLNIYILQFSLFPGRNYIAEKLNI